MKPYENYAAEDWAKLSGWSWAWVLIHQPQFSDYCYWETLNGKLDRVDWFCLLKNHPQFSIRCDWEKLNLELDGYDWACLLKNHPQFAGNLLVAGNV